MQQIEIAEKIKELFPTEVKGIKEFHGQISVTVKKERSKEILKYLRDTSEMAFNYLQDLCGVDYLGKKDVRFEVVYQLYSIKHKHAIRIKAEVPENDCSIDSVTDLWAGADWHERECFDLFGVNFIGHPDLRRILLPEDWEGHPLRKDYPLKSDLGEMEWKGFKEVLEVSNKNKVFDIR